MLTQGHRLGVYEVVGPLGAGGMGEVSRARDMRLNRDVALKVLPDRMMVVRIGATSPPALSQPAELFRMRFQRGYSVSRDGRLLVAQRVPEAPPTSVRVLMNRLTDLRARAPVS